MWPWVCSVIDHRRRQSVVRTSVTHSAIASCATFLFLPHFDVICDLLLNRRTATWNLFVNYTFVILVSQQWRRKSLQREWRFSASYVVCFNKMFRWKRIL